MTRDRIYGEASDFSEWLRFQEQIPSSLCVATDCDYIIHRYKMPIDNVGTRELQAQMILEVKTRNGEPRFAQLDTMRIHHRCANTANRRIRFKGNTIVHHGVSFLSLSGTTPENSDLMRWGRFDQDLEINWRPISQNDLILLLRFELHPDNLTRNPYRRHHKTDTLEILETYPLGFTNLELINLRS